MLGITLAAVALLAVLAVAWQWNWPEMLARRYQEQMSELPDSEVGAQLQRIVQLGDAGLPVLTAALGSQREIVRGTARTLLIEEVGRWELLPSEAATAKLSILAAALVKSSAQFSNVPFSSRQIDARDRRFAADLALRIMHWPQDGGNDARPSSLLADCERVLALCAAPHAASPPVKVNRIDGDVLRTAANAIAEPLSAASPRDAVNPGVDSIESLPALARLPGGGLPFELASLPPPIEIGRSRANDGDQSVAAEPQRLPERNVGRPLDEETEPSDLHDQAPAANQPRHLSNRDDLGNNRLLYAETDGRKAAELLRTGDEGLAAWKRLELRAVMRELHAADPQLAAAAQAELVRRGITGPLIELAHQAADPNPTVRQQCAASLPTLPGVDARPWLLELSYDEDANVRATAVTLMATSGDLELLKRVQQVSLDDPDDHTRAQAEKALPTAQRRK